MSRRPSLVAVLVLWLTLAPALNATWSIVLTDSATGEVAVGTATCLLSIDLKAFVPVIVVGKGAGATQSQVDPTGKNKKKMFAELTAGTPPIQIIQILKQDDFLKCSRQYGIADLQGRFAGFTGNCAQGFKAHFGGTVGTITYSLQGNVLTGMPVLDAARIAIETTPGRLSDKMMAAMEAARAMGGDGRCSCLTGNPPSCGAPPLGGFAKSAHVGTVVVARMGDTDGPCLGGTTGCAAGNYWLTLNFKGGAADVDPVFALQQKYDRFIDRMRGHPDGVLSSAFWRPPTPLGGGGTLLELDLDLRDIDGLPVPQGGARVHVGHAEGSAGLAVRNEVKDHGDGTYTVRLAAPPGAAGRDVFEISVNDGSRSVTLFPFPEMDYPAILDSTTGDTNTRDSWLQSWTEPLTKMLRLFERAVLGEAPGKARRGVAERGPQPLDQGR